MLLLGQLSHQVCYTCFCCPDSLVYSPERFHMANDPPNTTKYKNGERTCRIPAVGAVGPIAPNAAFGPIEPSGVLHMLLLSRLSGVLSRGVSHGQMTLRTLPSTRTVSARVGFLLSAQLAQQLQMPLLGQLSHHVCYTCFCCPDSLVNSPERFHMAK